MPKPKKDRPAKPIAMISSTTRDLPDHRKQVIEACLRAGFETREMETLTAHNANAAEISCKLVQDADVYIGIIAHQYGSCAADSEISYTELEYNEAKKLKI